MRQPQTVYTVRPATMSDAQTVTDLMIAFDIAEFGVPDCTLEDIIEFFQELPIETNTWIIESDKTIVAYGFLEEMSKGRLDCYGFVHPNWRNLGIGSILLDCMEKRAQDYIESYKMLEISYEINQFLPASNPLAISFLEKRGYHFDKVYSRMVIELNQAPGITNVSHGVHILPFEKDRDRKAIYEAYVESFQDTRGYYEEPFEKWIRKRSTDQHDPTLWFVAYYNHELVGFIICKNFPEGTYIELLGVKRAGRKMGIGAALLTTVFKESYQRGVTNVLLNVDANSLTGANRLYEKVGMKPMFQMACYKKTSSVV